MPNMLSTYDEYIRRTDKLKYEGFDTREEAEEFWNTKLPQWNEKTACVKTSKDGRVPVKSQLSFSHFYKNNDSKNNEPPKTLVQKLMDNGKILLL